MQRISGTVVNGKIMLDGNVTLPDGTQVDVIAHEDDAPEMTPELEAALLESIEQIERGEYFTWDEVRKTLGGRHADRDTDIAAGQS